MKKCKICFECDSNSAKTIVALILDKVSNLSMLDLSDDLPEKAKPNGRGHTSHWVTKYSNEVLDVFKKRGVEVHSTDKELIAAIESAGLKETSMSPLLSDMVKFGKLVRIRKGWFRLPNSNGM